MPKSEYWFRVDVASLPRGVIVVDATAASRGLWNSLVRSTLEGCAECLPRGRWPDVVFLGDHVSHPLDAVLRGLGSTLDLGPGPAVRVDAELGRAPWIGPWLSRCGDTPPPTVLALNQTKVLDLDDWSVPDVVRSTLVYRFTGTDRITPNDWSEAGAHESDFSVVPATLNDPLTRVEVTCDGGVSIGWDSAGLEWSNGGVAGQAPAEPFRVGFQAESTPMPRASGRRTSQTWVDLPVKPEAPSVAPDQSALSGGEVTVLNNWASANPRPYYCAACHPKEHAVGEVRCQTTTERPLFPTLGKYPPGTLCELERRSMSWVARPRPHGVAVLEDGRVMVLRPPGRTPAFNKNVDGKWVPAAPAGDRFWKGTSGRFLVVT